MLKQLIGHGVILTRKTKRRAYARAHANNGALDAAPSAQPLAGRFDYLFPQLITDPQNTLQPGQATIQALRDLGAAMAKEQSELPTTAIPTGYTYFGQFIDHDITKQEIAKKRDQTCFDITRDDFLPLTRQQIHTKLINERTAPFDLDSLYSDPAPRQGDQMVLGPNAKNLPKDKPASALPVGKDPANNDLPRAAQNSKKFKAKQALIGDPRNDENLIISQMQVAFLKFHNQFVEKQQLSFDQAAKAVRQHYQAVVIYDFLPRIAEPAVVDEILKANRLFLASPDDGLFMPLEFSAAAFRFGHSMIRPTYNYNLNFMPAQLADLFSFTAFSGHIGPAENLDVTFTSVPFNWIIQWENFLALTSAVTPQHTMSIDTALALPLAELSNQQDIMARLAQRNLLRGYLLNLPTGQSVARCIGGEGEVLTAQEILASANPADFAVLEAHPALTQRTPLWYYILIEAKHRHAGQRLGLVGSTIIVETIIGLIRQSKDSILNDASWQPTLGREFPTQREHLELRHIIEFAGLGPKQTAG